jgi:hypothetical protein
MKHQQLTFVGEERKEQYTSTKLWTFSLGILSWKRNKSHGNMEKRADSSTKSLQL